MELTAITMTAGRTDRVPALRVWRRGVSLIELGYALVIAGILMTLGLPSLRRFMVQQRVDRATDAIQWQITVARSYAIRSGRSVDLVVNSGTRTLTVAENGTAWSTLQFDSGSGLAVDSLRLDASDSKMTFSFRGFCLTCGGEEATTITVWAGTYQRSLAVNFLGRVERMPGEG